MTDPRTLAWHFLPANGCLAHGDGRKVAAGVTYRVDGPLKLCRRGLHYSRRAIDALVYASGPIVCRVAIGGERVKDSDKGCCTERTVLWLADASRALHEFACWCAESALAAERAAGRVPDPRSEAAVAMKRRWLVGKATDDELRAARSAARFAEAWSAAAAAAAAEAAAEPSWAAARWAAVAARTVESAAAQNVELERLLLALAPAGAQL